MFSLVASGSLAGIVLFALRPFPSLNLVAVAIQVLLNALAAALLLTPSSSAWFHARVESGDPAA